MYNLVTIYALAKKCQLHCYSSQVLDFCQDILYYLGSVKQTFQCIEGNRVLGSESWSSNSCQQDVLFCRQVLVYFEEIHSRFARSSLRLEYLHRLTLLVELTLPSFAFNKIKYRQEYVEVQSFRSCREKKIWLVTTIEYCIAALARRKKEEKETCRKKKKGRRILSPFSFPPIHFYSTDSLQ